jgi:K+-transporting ATPase KdpF subunit
MGALASMPKFDGRRIMNWLYLIAGLISLALFVYLIVALLRPEVF